MKKNKKGEEAFGDISLDGLARMVADGFSGVNARIDGLDGRMGGLDKRMDGLDGRMDGLDGRMDALERTVNIHMRDVRAQTDRLAHRTKKLEETVFGVGKYPV